MMEDHCQIEDHANHRPRHYKDSPNPIVYGILSRSPSPLQVPPPLSRPPFSPGLRQFRAAVARFLRRAAARCAAYWSGLVQLVFSS